MPFIAAFEVAAPEMFATAAGAEFGTAAAFDALGAEALGAGALGLEGLGAGAGLFGEFGGSLAGQAFGGAPLGEAITQGITSGGAGAGASGINEALVNAQQTQAVNSGLSQAELQAMQRGQEMAQNAKDLGQVAEGTGNAATQELIQNAAQEVPQGLEQTAQQTGNRFPTDATTPNVNPGGPSDYMNKGITGAPEATTAPWHQNAVGNPLNTPSGLEAGFNKALQYVKDNPFSAASMGYSAMKLLGGNKKEEAPDTSYNGILSKYKMSPNFKGRQANPQDFQYTPQQYNYAEGGIASFKAGGDPGAKLAMDYYESMQRQQNNAPAPARGPLARAVLHDTGTYYDLDPDTQYLDPVTAAQVRMAKVNKRANMQMPGMKRPTPMGQLNLAPPGVKAAAASSSLDPETMAAQGGIMHSSLGGYAAGGNPRLLKGPGDGMSDNIPATISGKQPARLADGEFVIPADVVSHLGNGSTDAGAKVLHAMMDKVRQARTGNSKQGKQINPNKFVPT